MSEVSTDSLLILLSQAGVQQVQWEWEGKTVSGSGEQEEIS